MFTTKKIGRARLLCLPLKIKINRTSFQGKMQDWWSLHQAIFSRKIKVSYFYCKNDEISPKSFLIGKKHHRDLAHPKPFCSKKVEL